MKVNFKGILRLLILGIFSLCFVFSANAQSHSQDGIIFDVGTDSEFVIQGTPVSGQLEYGRTSLGQFSLKGGIAQNAIVEGKSVYGITEAVELSYTYDGSYHSSNTSEWNLCGSGVTKVNGIDLGIFNGVGQGTIIVQKSTDGENWELATTPLRDHFASACEDDSSVFYTVNEEDVSTGLYFKVIIAYEMRKLTNDGFAFFDKWAYRRFVEVYEFYIISEKQQITFSNISTHQQITSDSSSVQTGFFVQKNGSTHDLTVINPEGDYTTPSDYAFFYAPGEYQLHEKTIFDTVYSSTITISEGTSFYQVPSRVYDAKRNQGFSLESSILSSLDSPVVVSIAVPRTGTVTESDTSDRFAVGVSGQSVALYLQLNQDPKSWSEECKLVADTWGKQAKELVNGVQTGEVGKGALIIQTSTDGTQWSEPDMGKYANGLYTTDYASHYGNQETVMIYTPSGQDILNGIFIRVIFAYQTQNLSNNEVTDHIAVSTFYLCCTDLDAVTFHNHSAEAIFAETYGEADETTISLYKHSETMQSGSCTTTGFSVDTTLNPTVNYTIEYNGQSLTKTNDDTYVNEGRYDIHLVNALGKTKDIVLYIDRATDEEAMTRYFGNGFITSKSKRIFSEGTIPVFEGGETQYHLEKITDAYLPLTGYIRNETTGETISIECTDGKSVDIINPGQYTVILANNPRYFSGEYTGDVRLFEFHFSIIEKGTAPGPVVNQRLLKEYSHTSVADANPIHYCLTYQSAKKGYITLVFASREAAYNYAYNYQKGMVEKQDDGTYRYNGPFLIARPKTKYSSVWDLTDAVSYFANAAIQESCFDLSDVTTYLTLSEETLSTVPNLRTLELEHSITIFAEGEREGATTIDALPILNDKPYATLDTVTGEIKTESLSFQFVTDSYGGIDSRKVTITDKNGKKHQIEYGISVGQQLQSLKCPSGIVTITEATCNGDTAQYRACFVADGDTQVEVSLELTFEGKTTNVILNNETPPNNLTADSFKLTSVEDSLLVYPLIIVRDQKQHEWAFTKGSNLDSVWADKGTYTIICINRLGTKFEHQIKVTGKTEIVTEITAVEIQSVEELVAESDRANILPSKNFPWLAIVMPIFIVFAAILFYVGKKNGIILKKKEADNANGEK